MTNNKPSVFQILKEISSTSSRNEKIMILQSHKDNSLLKQVMKLTLDSRINFYIKRIPEYTPTNQKDLQWAVQALEPLYTRKVTGNAAIEHLVTILSSLTEEDAYVVERIIDRNLRCDVSSSTVNKVWKDLIWSYPVMLCSPNEQKYLDKIMYPARCDKKEDGLRCNIHIKGNFVDLFSREGKLMNVHGKFDYLTGLIQNSSVEYDIVLDGELLVKKSDGIGFLDRKTGNGIANKAIKGTISEEEAERLHFVVYDIIPYEDFMSRKCNTDLLMRTLTLMRLFEVSKKDFCHNVSVVELQFVESFDEAKKFFDRMISTGYEGIILKDSTSIWEDKRTTKQIKFKNELECELKVVGIQEGTGKYVGMIGALVCESECGILKTNVGSGFSDELRSLDKFAVGDIITVKYNEKIKDKNGNVSLFLPILIEKRLDKTIANTEQEIQ